MKSKKLGLFLAITLLVAFALPSQAGESLFGWVYTTDLTPKGAFEFEHISDLQHRQSQGTYEYLRHREEIEYGVTDNFQISGYLNWSMIDAYRNGKTGTTEGPGTDLGANDDPFGRFKRTTVDSISMELIYRLMNPYTDSFGLALYLEPTWGPKTKELEMKLLLQKNFIDDRLIVAANISTALERNVNKEDIERATELDIVAGASYRFKENWSAGLEARNHNEFAGYGYYSQDHAAYFIGPNLHYATQKYWITAAWRHQLPWANPRKPDQEDVVVGGRIYGDEHSRDQFVVKVGIPF